MNRRSFMKFLPALGVAAVLPKVLLDSPVTDTKTFTTSTTKAVNLNLEVIPPERPPVNNPLMKQYHSFPMKITGWEKVRF